MTAYWLPGDHHGLIWSGGTALVSGSVPTGLVLDLWQRCKSGVDMGEFLEALAQHSELSLLSLPPFAVALESGVLTHVAARGAINLDVVTADGQAEQITGTQVSTWVERQLSHVVGWRIGTDEAADEGIELPTVGGVVPARSLRSGDWYAQPARRDLDLEASELTVRRLPDGPPSPPASARLPTAEADAATPGEQAAQAVTAAELPESDSMPVNQPAPDEAGEPAETMGEPAAATPQPTMGPTMLPETWISQDGSRPTDLEPIAAPPPPPSQFDQLWGATQVVLVDDAAVAQQVTEASVGDAGVPKQEAPELADINDHDAMTIVSLDDEPAPIEPPTPQAAAAVGTVVAIYCPLDHINPTHRSVCRVCEAPLLGEPARIARPGLGWVRSPEGERIELTSPVIIGRNPRADRVQGTDLPRLIALPNGHISSNHLAIKLEGWNVLAVDLQSRNGTYLRRPGQPPMRLPEQPTMLVSGDVLDLGHGVQFSFEELP